MSASFVITPKAGEDLKQIVDFLHEEASYLVARQFLEQAMGSFELLATSPGLGRRWASGPAHDEAPLRCCRVDRFPRYLIFYRVEAETLTVARVLHGMRDLDALLPDEE